MTERLSIGVIRIKNIDLWAHVGVLEEERLLGQYFSLDISLWLPIDSAAKEDDLSASADYSDAIREIQILAFELQCLTIETFSEEILNCLEHLYGPVPMYIFLRKCSAPIHGFDGTVGIERTRYSPP